MDTHNEVDMPHDWWVPVGPDHDPGLSEISSSKVYLIHFAHAHKCCMDVRHSESSRATREWWKHQHIVLIDT